MPLIKRRALLLAKSESSYDSDPTPTAASNSLLTIDIDVSRTFTAVERDSQLASMTHKQDVGAEKFITVTFQTELYGSGADATAPRLGTLLKACGFGETVNSPTDVTYAPISTSIESCTLYIYLDGLRHIVTGCYGTFKLTCTAGMPAKFEWTFMGNYAAKTDTALASPTFESTVDNIPLCKSASLTLNSDSTLIVNEVSVDMNNTIAKRPSINKANAIVGFELTDRRPTATIDPEAELVAGFDFETDVLTTPRNLNWRVGDTDGNQCLITIPSWNYTDIQYGDREGLLIETITGQASDNGSGDDEITFKFD